MHSGPSGQLTQTEQNVIIKMKFSNRNRSKLNLEILECKHSPKRINLIMIKTLTDFRATKFSLKNKIHLFFISLKTPE
jgi:hypothetical protein